MAPLLASGDLVEIAPGRALDVPLYWQRWSLEAEVLKALGDAVAAAARSGLRPMRTPPSAGWRIDAPAMAAVHSHEPQGAP